jgi:AcrR family transcriptional regulator
MARTKEFDPDKALKIAVSVFWRLGYEHTSLETLMREMGISKQSLYDTFGDKRSIYFRAMSRYRGDTNAYLRGLFAQEKSVKRGFAKLFRAMIRQNKPGKFLTNDRHEMAQLLRLNTLALWTSPIISGTSSSGADAADFCSWEQWERTKEFPTRRTTRVQRRMFRASPRPFMWNGSRSART